MNKLRQLVKIPYVCFTHGNGYYSAVPFYKVMRLFILRYFDGPCTHYTRIVWDTLPRNLKRSNTPIKRVITLKNK